MTLALVSLLLYDLTLCWSFIWYYLCITCFYEWTLLSSPLIHMNTGILSGAFFSSYVTISLSLPGGLWVSTSAYEGPWAACQPAVRRLRKTVSFLFLACYRSNLHLFTINCTHILLKFQVKHRKKMWTVKDVEGKKREENYLIKQFWTFRTLSQNV